MSANDNNVPKIRIINAYDTGTTYTDASTIEAALTRIQASIDSSSSSTSNRLDAMAQRLHDTEHVLDETRSNLERTRALLAEMDHRQKQMLQFLENLTEDTQYLCNITTAPNPLQKERLFNMALRTKTAIPFQKQDRP